MNMKLLLLHGNAKVSRERLIEEKNKFSLNDVTMVDGGISFKEIIGALSTIQMFEERVFIVENPGADFILDSSFLTSTSSLILWFDHDVSKKPILEQVKKLNGQVVFFPEPKQVSVFPFLDLLAQKDKLSFVELNKLKLSGCDIFYLITMVFYLLRSLAVTPKNAPPFVVQKLDKQRKNFNLEKVTRLYKEVIEIDFKLKKGLLEKDQAEFLLINKFIN